MRWWIRRPVVWWPARWRWISLRIRVLSTAGRRPSRSTTALRTLLLRLLLLLLLRWSTGYRSTRRRLLLLLLLGILTRCTTGRRIRRLTARRVVLRKRGNVVIVFNIILLYHYQEALMQLGRGPEKPSHRRRAFNEFVVAMDTLYSTTNSIELLFNGSLTLCGEFIYLHLYPLPNPPHHTVCSALVAGGSILCDCESMPCHR